MVISVSRRTDIPAFYTEWFLNRIKAGYVDVINPFNTKQANRISLKKEDTAPGRIKNGARLSGTLEGDSAVTSVRCSASASV